MTALITLLGFAAIIAWVVLKVSQHQFSPSVGVRAAVGFVLVFVVAQLLGAVVIVPAGSRAVIFDKFTGVKPVVLNEGFNLVMPFIQEAIIFDVRVQKADVKAPAASKDLQDVSTEVVLNFRPRPDAVAKIYREYGTDYESKVVTPAVQEAVKAVVATYNAEQIITEREKLKAQVHEHLAKMIASADLELVETYMTNFSFSKGFSDAIESKQVAQQNALKAQRDLERVKFEADQKITQAQAEATGLRAQRDAISPELLKLRQIEVQAAAVGKWDGHLPQTMMGDTVPFIQMPKP